MTGPELTNNGEAEVFERLGGEFEQVVYCHDPAVGLRAIIAVHSTVLGPAMGGTRFLPYASGTDALVDVLRLARGMTYKQSAAGLDYGGGKAVILGAPASVRSSGLIRSYAGFLHRMGGTYLTAEDVGTTQADMDLIAEETPYVTGTSIGRGGSGDPSPATAWGVVHAMEAVAERLWGDRSLTARRIVVSGVGKVGTSLVGHLVERGAVLTVADPDEVAIASLVASLAAEHGSAVRVVNHHEAHLQDCDIWSPCALGGGLNVDSIPGLRCAAVCGAANNQLAGDADAERLAEHGIVYVPDYIANAGGVINISEEPAGYERDRAFAHVTQIYDTTVRVLDRAEADGITTAAAADRIAEDRIAAGRRD